MSEAILYNESWNFKRIKLLPLDLFILVKLLLFIIIPIYSSPKVKPSLRVTKCILQDSKDAIP